MDTDASSQVSTPTSVFQKAAGDVVAQRLESIALEVRAIGSAQAGLFASSETLGLMAAVLRTTLKKIDQLFEFDGFVFTPACSLMLEMFQARARGGTVSISTLSQDVGCPLSVSGRWVKLLSSMQMVEVINESCDNPTVALTEKGYLKTVEALKLLL